MQINQDALERMKSAPVGRQLAMIFETLLQTIEDPSKPAHHVMSFSEHNDEVGAGDYIPVVTLSLYPSDGIDSTSDGDSSESTGGE